MVRNNKVNQHLSENIKIFKKLENFKLPVKFTKFTGTFKFKLSYGHGAVLKYWQCQWQ